MKRLTLAAGLSLALVSCGGNSAAGTYALDIEALRKKALAEAPAGAADTMAKTMDQLFADMKMEVTLRGDGTFSTSGKMMGQAIDGSGTYTVDGDKITMTTTVENGKKRDKTESKTATLKNGVITIDEGGQAIQLKKK